MKAIAYSLYGTNPMYHIGALENVRLAKTLYPDWRCVFYVASDVPLPVRIKLNELGAQLYERLPANNNWRGMLWKLETVDDPFFTEVVFRDTDSRHNPREQSAVNEWLASGKPVHAMHDHRYHTAPLMGGMWGARTEYLRSMGFMDRLSAFLSLVDAGVYPKRIGRYACSDQPFLRDDVWPVVKDCTLIHNPEDFKVKLAPGMFVGQVYDANNNPVMVK